MSANTETKKNSGKKTATAANTTSTAAAGKTAATGKTTTTGITTGAGNTAATSTTTVGKKNTQQQTTPFEKLFEDLLKDIYWAEQQLTTALKQMHDAATTDELKDAFEDHLYVTQKHVSRLEKVFSLIGVKAEAKKCDAMEGLIKEGQRVIQETKEGTMTRDAGLIIAAQKVEHYEIAAYGSLVQVALTLGHKRAAGLLEKTLTEEEDTDLLLTDIAETEVNPMADEEGDEEMKEPGASAAPASSSMG